MTLSIFNLPMALNTYWNNIEVILRLISVMVMPFFCLSVANYTNLGVCLWEFPRTHSGLKHPTRFDFIRMIFVVISHRCFSCISSAFRFMVKLFLFLKSFFVFLSVCFLVYSTFLFVFLPILFFIRTNLNGFLVQGSALFTYTLMTVVSSCGYVELINSLYNLTLRTPLIHTNLQNEKPLASVGLVRKQRAESILSRLYLLVPNTNLSSGIIS